MRQNCFPAILLKMGTSRRRLSKLAPHALVACNIYVSAGRSHHGDLLLKVLTEAQDHCTKLRSTTGEEIAVVHAFSDGSYDRSSFHLAGRPLHVANVATILAEKAIQRLLLLPRNEAHMKQSKHPFVGLVDHVAVMSLTEGDIGHVFPTTLHSNTLHGRTAEYIGNQLKENGVDVHFYGTACPDGTTLADVRRLRTNFFHSGGLDADTTFKTRPTNRKGVATIGAPPTFVENFNIRLTDKCNQNMARSLTKAIRERDGGLVGVEGLTLPYSNNRYEIACNLLQPDVGSAEAIMERTQEWAQKQLQSLPHQCMEDLVETGYRVGTTSEQCLRVLSLSSGELQEHDDHVVARLKEFLGLL